MSDDQDQPVDQEAERPIGVEEQKTIESQERDAGQVEQSVSETEEPETTTPKEQVDEILEGGKEKERPKKQDSTRNLFGQFTKHFRVSKIASAKTANTLKQIQKQLTQIDRTTAIINKQQTVVKQLAGQVRTIQKQLDRISGSINRIKTVTGIKGKASNSKSKKK